MAFDRIERSERQLIVFAGIAQFPAGQWFERDEHPDFHLPSDTPDRIDREGLLRVTQVVAVTAWTLAQ